MEMHLKCSENKTGKFSAIFIFFALIIRMFALMPKSSDEMSDPWSIIFYAVNYKTMGFVPRGLVGTICTLFTDKISQKSIYIISVCATILLIFIVCFFINKIVSHMGSYERLTFLSVIGLWLLAPNNVFYIFDTEHYGITDIYFIMLTLLVVNMLKSKYLKWSVPIILALSMAIYEGYFFAFGSVISILLLYMILKSEKKSHYILLTVISAVVVIGSFIYFGILFRSDFLAAVPFENFEEAKKVISSQTDVGIPYMFEQLFFWESSLSIFSDGRWNVAEVTSSTSALRLQYLPVILLIYAILLYLWISAFRSEKEKKIKVIYVFCALSPLISLPLFVFSQQMKYSTYIIWCQLILAGFFSINEDSFSQQLKKVGKFIAKNPLYVFISWIAMIFFKYI